MDTVTRLLALFSRWDPAGWIALQKSLTVPASAFLGLLGLGVCLFGSGKLLRLVIVPPAALAGFVLGPMGGELLKLKPNFAALGAAGVLAAAGLLHPPTALFVAVGALGGLFGGELAGRADYWLGFAPGFLVAGVLVIGFYRFAAAAVAGVVGGAMLVLGALSLTMYTALGPAIAAYPLLPVLAVGAIAIGSVVYEIALAPNPEEKAKLAAEKKRRAAALKEDKARMKRFEKHDAAMRANAGKNERAG